MDVVTLGWIFALQWVAIVAIVAFMLGKRHERAKQPENMFASTLRGLMSSAQRGTIPPEQSDVD